MLRFKLTRTFNKSDRFNTNSLSNIYFCLFLVNMYMYLIFGYLEKYTSNWCIIFIFKSSITFFFGLYLPLTCQWWYLPTNYWLLINPLMEIFNSSVYSFFCLFQKTGTFVLSNLKENFYLLTAFSSNAQVSFSDLGCQSSILIMTL